MTTYEEDYQRKPVTLLKDAHIEAISLVDKGANGHRFILLKRAHNYVDESGAINVEGPESASVEKELPLIKGGPSADQWKVAYSIVAVPNEVDIQKDVWDEDEIRKAAHDFLKKNKPLINFMHKDLNRVGDLVESAVALTDIQIGENTIKKGSWYIGIEPYPELKKRIEVGEITGVSVQGSSKRVPVAPEAEFEVPAEENARPVMKFDAPSFGPKKKRPVDEAPEAPEAEAPSEEAPEAEAPEKDDRHEDSFDYRHIPLGAEGPGIKKLQKILNMPQSGVYDEDTEDAFEKHLMAEHPDTEGEPTIEHLKACIAACADKQPGVDEVREPEAPEAHEVAAAMAPPTDPEKEVEKDHNEVGGANGYDPAYGVSSATGDTATQEQIGSHPGNMGTASGTKLTPDSSSEDLKVALFTAYKQGDPDLIRFARDSKRITSAEQLLREDLPHEVLWYMYSRLVMDTVPTEGEAPVEKAQPVTNQPGYTSKEALEEGAGVGISKSDKSHEDMSDAEKYAYLFGRDDVEKCAGCQALKKLCPKHANVMIAKADSWLPEGVSEGDLNDSDFAWVSNGYKNGTTSKSEGRKLPYKVYGKVNPKGWKAAWAMTAKANLADGPNADKVRTKLMRDIPKGVKVNRSLLKGAMFDEVEHPLARFTDKKGQLVFTGDVVLDPSGNAVEVSSVEMEGTEATLVRTVRVNAKGNEVVKEYKPEQLQAVASVGIVKSSAGGSMGGHDPRANGKIRFIVRSFGKWAGGKHSICVRRMKTEHPEVFKGNEDAGCAWLKDQWLHDTHWRNGGHGKGLAKGSSAFVNRLNTDLILKNAPVIAGETSLDPENIHALYTVMCRDLGVDPAEVESKMGEHFDAYLDGILENEMETGMEAPELNEQEQGLVRKFVDFMKGNREEVSKSVEAPERPKITATQFKTMMNALELGLHDALANEDLEARAADLSHVVSDFGAYVSENLSNSEFVTDEPAEATSEESTETVETSEDVEKHGVVEMEAEVPPALTPRKKKQTTDSNMEENMEKSTDVEKTRERLVAEAGAFMSELVEAPEAEATELEKEAPEGEETHTLTLDEVALFADRLADRLDLIEGSNQDIAKSLGSKLDSVVELAKSLDITDRITALEEQIASLKTEVAPAEQVEEVAKRVQELEQQPGHSTQAGEVREAVAKAATAPLFTRPGGYSIF